MPEQSTPETLYHIEIVSRSPKVTKEIGALVADFLSTELSKHDEELSALYAEDEAAGTLDATISPSLGTEAPPAETRAV